MDIGSSEFVDALVDALTKLEREVIDHANHAETEEFNKLQRELGDED
jgi:hypothetical protein